MDRALPCPLLLMAVVIALIVVLGWAWTLPERPETFANRYGGPPALYAEILAEQDCMELANWLRARIVDHADHHQGVMTATMLRQEQLDCPY